ncbi:MAG: Cation transporter [uncultured Thiotrichaceae bacterium]|uniref:Cation transporter n=1 Tax=uncultured Thiotrichaceae bacterium TaxID=298394 RepID=A0A6S6T0Z1_9GAMM|nr:MAG: Cation transporter [uncultured Thiotrichaceae bacterium]
MSSYLRFLLIGLVVFWLLLSGFWDNTLLLVLGAASVLLVTYLAFRIERVYPLLSLTRMLYRLPQYTAWLFLEVIKTNVDVVKCIWLPGRYPISPALAIVPMTQQTRVGKTIYANSITLTPGTVTVRLEQGGHLLVHALTEEGIVDLRAGAMDLRVTELEEKRS